MNIILLRHGQTLFNQLQYTQGWFDSPLTKLGIRQAERAKDLLKEEVIDFVYSSYSERAYDTAEIALGDRDIKINRDKRLKEVNFGVFEGNPDPFYHKMIEQLSFLPNMDASNFAGDSQEDVINRQLNLIEELNEKYQNKTILLGGHGCSLKLLVDTIAKESIKEYDPNYHFMANADAIKIDYNGKNSKVLKIFYNGVTK